MAENGLVQEQPRGRGPTGAIRRAHLSMQRCADTILRPRRITTDQFSLLWNVARKDGIRQNDLAAELFTDPNTVTAMLSRLEARGLLYREVCPEDARARHVHLTAAGRKLTALLSDDWEPMRLKLREVFSGERGAAALQLLEEVRDLMTRSRDEALVQQAALKKRASARTGSRRPQTAQI